MVTLIYEFNLSRGLDIFPDLVTDWSLVSGSFRGEVDSGISWMASKSDLPVSTFMESFLSTFEISAAISNKISRWFQSIKQFQDDNQRFSDLLYRVFSPPPILQKAGRLKNTFLGVDFICKSFFCHHTNSRETKLTSLKPELPSNHNCNPSGWFSLRE